MMEDKLKKFVTENKEAFDRHTPSPQVWNRVKSRIEPPTRVKRMPVQWMWSAAAVLVLFTFGTIWVLEHPATHVDEETTVASYDESQGIPHTTKTPAKVSKETNSPMLVHVDSKEQPSTSYHRPRNETRERSLQSTQKVDVDTREKLALALLNDQNSAINRIDGVLKMRELSDISHETMEQLHYAVVHDPNSNVRLAAWELMMTRTPESEWEQKIQDVFVQQDDLSLQMELMQVMAHIDSISINAATANRLQEITEDPLVIDLAKEQAYAVLMKNW